MRGTNRIRDAPQCRELGLRLCCGRVQRHAALLEKRHQRIENFRVVEILLLSAVGVPRGRASVLIRRRGQQEKPLQVAAKLRRGGCLGGVFERRGLFLSRHDNFWMSQAREQGGGIMLGLAPGTGKIHPRRSVLIYNFSEQHIAFAFVGDGDSFAFVFDCDFIHLEWLDWW